MNNVTYNKKTSPPKVDNVCDNCKGGNFFIRSDDNMESIRVRLLTYKKQTQQIARYYQDRHRYLNVAARLSTNEIYKKIHDFIK